MGFVWFWIVAVMIAAYVVLVPGVAADGAELQQFLRSRLPRYMVPAICTVLDELPLTPTGKVDVASLPAPVRSGPGGTGVTGLPFTTRLCATPVMRETAGAQM